jgi:hypothetical protein
MSVLIRAYATSKHVACIFNDLRENKLLAVIRQLFSLQLTFITPSPQLQYDSKPVFVAPPAVVSSVTVPPAADAPTTTASQAAALQVVPPPTAVDEGIAAEDSEGTHITNRVPVVMSETQTSEEIPENIPPPPEFYFDDSSDRTSEIPFLPAPPEEYSTGADVVAPPGGQHANRRRTEGCILELTFLNFDYSLKNTTFVIN